MSVPSTWTICIVPGGTSATVPTATRRVPAGSVTRSGGLGCGGRPLVLEQLPQSLLRPRQRDPRDHRLEEPHDDELASEVARQSAALQVEDLRLVDRPDRARVARSPDVGLVDLQRRDRY